MRNTNFIYVATAVGVLSAVLLGMSFLLQTTSPTTDVLLKWRQERPLIRISDYQPGDVHLVNLNDIPVYIWRRNDADIALAKSQDVPSSWRVKHSIATSSSTRFLAHDAALTIDHEWFFALARNPAGPGCVPLPRAGDYHGFIDRCRGTHFDLAGRVHKGPSDSNLIIVSAQKTNDGDFIELDLSH